ncbi:serine/threonine protein kinase [Paenibacillus sp. CFBP13512]|uniref:protein kinase domain-containing protein n=1 Tax=Paenibacillus sp. CFBP13512 TaxID=2184007 RepID=UPI0010C0C0AC|nr:protein kinase [Paenibacillus sp. CFBP13512]TKJ83844.1 serine/threonine protein kinase [Paenibacillus sp. CFBP13512]
MKKENYGKGMQFGEWILVSYINGGGNGAVWKAKKGDDFRAIKLLKTLNKKTLARFNDEIKTIVENKDIQGILPIYDYFISPNLEDTSWYVMPIASSIKLKTDAMSHEEKVDLIIKIGKIIVELHQKEIVHRDIKPGNLLFYNDEYYLADFGLVDYPNKDDITRKDESVGPRWTMAPEMKRSPKDADGKKADVYSLAKTLWIFLTGEEFGFDGQYSSESKNSLNAYHSTLFSDPLDQLLYKSTSHDPNERPSMEQFIELLREWQEQNRDYVKRNPYEWKMVQKKLFPTNIPSRVVWETKEDIIQILNIVGNINSLNHMFLADGGGMDLSGASLAPEEDCIVLAIGYKIIIKPIRLLFESIGRDSEWNYFRLEYDSVSPLFHNYSKGRERLLIVDGNYKENEGDFQLEFDYTRYTDGGAMVIFMKTSTYNKISSTYDGRHNKMTTDEFKLYIEKMASKKTT